MRGDETRELIKLTARRLFAQHGVDGVTVRQIVTASGQKNGGSLHYYFRTKEALIHELIVDTAELIEARRDVALDKLEAEGGPHTVREVLEVLVLTSIHLGLSEGEEDTYLRFISLLALQQRKMLDEVLEDRLKAGYQRCLGHIRRLVGDQVGKETLERRFVFMSISLRAIMAAREAALDNRREHKRFWTARGTMDDLLESLEGMIVYGGS